MKCVKCKDTGIVKFKYLVDKPLDHHHQQKRQSNTVVFFHVNNFILN